MNTDDLRNRAKTLRQGHWSDGAEDAELMEGAAAEIDKLRELCWCLLEAERVGGTSRDWHELHDRASELGMEVE